MTQQEALIALTKIKGVGLRTIHRILECYADDLPRIFTDTTADIERRTGLVLRNFNLHDEHIMAAAKAEMEFMDKHNIHAMVYGTKQYPSRLAQCADAPLMLYSTGNFDYHRPLHYIGVVGTRTPTPYGKDICANIVEGLAHLVPDSVIISGLAYGIDVTAHRAAISSGLPTVAVMGHGLDRIYPYVHRDTAKQIIANGALLTEYTSGTQPDGPNFVQRDRIIAGMSDVVIVVESKAKGGSLITAHYALEYNRDVMAVPGRRCDTTSAGCNQLIKRNVAALVETAEDIVNAMQWDAQQPKQLQLFEQELTNDEQHIYDILVQYPDGLQVNDIVPLAGMPFHRISALLFNLEDKNIISIAPGSVYRVKKH